MIWLSANRDLFRQNFLPSELRKLCLHRLPLYWGITRALGAPGHGGRNAHVAGEA